MITNKEMIHALCHQLNNNLMKAMSDSGHLMPEDIGGKTMSLGFRVEKKGSRVTLISNPHSVVVHNKKLTMDATELLRAYIDHYEEDGDYIKNKDEYSVSFHLLAPETWECAGIQFSGGSFTSAKNMAEIVLT